MERSLRRRRIEVGGRHRMLQLRQAAPKIRPDLGRARGRRHSVGAAEEQFILQCVPQPVERVAHRRLGQSQPFAGPRDAAFLRQRVEHAQEVEVEGVEMNFAHLERDHFSFES